MNCQKENKPGGSYVPYSQVGNILFISGQTCKWNGVLQYAGKIGKNYTTEIGKNYTTEKAKAVARLFGNNISDLMPDVFGKNGEHARVPASSNSLVIFEVEL